MIVQRMDALGAQAAIRVPCPPISRPEREAGTWSAIGREPLRTDEGQVERLALGAPYVHRPFAKGCEPGQTDLAGSVAIALISTAGDEPMVIMARQYGHRIVASDEFVIR